MLGNAQHFRQPTAFAVANNTQIPHNAIADAATGGEREATIGGSSGYREKSWQGNRIWRH
jgi:hypothetical protein